MTAFLSLEIQVEAIAHDTRFNLRPDVTGKARIRSPRKKQDIVKRREREKKRTKWNRSRDAIKKDERERDKICSWRSNHVNHE